MQPAPGERSFTFWIAPATLVFEKAWNIDGRVGSLHDLMEIADIPWNDPPDGGTEPEWHIEDQNLDLRLRAADYTQYLRPPPRQASLQMLLSGGAALKPPFSTRRRRGRHSPNAPGLCAEFPRHLP